MHYLATTGTRRERAVEHGRATKGPIRDLLETYRQTFHLEGGGWAPDLDPETRRAEVDRRLQNYSRTLPTICDEFEGIAEGSGLDMTDVAELNLVFELGQTPLPCCSVYGFRGTDGVLLGKSDDAVGRGELGWNAVQKVAATDGLSSVQMHFVGTVWSTSAVNEAGFAFGMTGLRARTGYQEGIPTLFLLHLLAEKCSTVREAEELCSGYEVSANGMSILMGDATGDIAILEKHVAGQAIRHPSGLTDAAWQTNHCCDPSIVPADDPDFEIRGNSESRFENIALHNPDVDHTFEGLTALFKTHDRPGGLCQHGADDMYTDTAIVLSPTERAMWATEGNPCEKPYISHSVPEARVGS